MFWIGLVYVLFASVIAFWIGKPIIWLAFDNEKFNAAFRYALVRLRDASEAVAFYRGEIAERTGLRRRFASVVANYKHYINRMIGFYGWNLSHQPGHRAAALRPAVPAVLRRRDQARRHDAVARRRSAASRTGCRSSATPTTSSPATARRSSVCTAWSIANEEGRALPDGDDGGMRGRHRAARRRSRSARPTASQLVNPLDLRLEVGDTLVDHRQVGQRQDDAAAQPRRAVAVHLRHADPSVRAERDDVPVADAVRPARRSARRRLLPV